MRRRTSEYPILNIRYPIFNLGYSISDIGYWIFSTALVIATAACSSQVAERPSNAQTSAVQAVAQTDFARLIERLSEPGGFFDTDNLISNERSYLHVLGKMRLMGVTGGAYLGVGPGQNFSYIAQIRPNIAFMIDIRRDNLLQHFLYKALFELSETRVEYMSMLFGRRPPANPSEWRERPIEDLVSYIDQRSSEREVVATSRTAIDGRIRGFGMSLSDTDLGTIRRFHDAFINAGLGLRFNSFGRAPQPYYPDLRQLVLETDLTGKHANYLADEASFAFLKSMQERNVIVPVVGDLAGRQAVEAVGEYLREIGDEVSAFYTSNVEFYLMGGRGFNRYADNVAGLPRTERSVIIRSFFGGGFRGRHPQAIPGYYSTQLLQTMDSFVDEYGAGGFFSYMDVVTKHSLPLR